MAVRYTKARLNKPKQVVEITFAVEYATWNKMKYTGESNQHPCTLDYIASVINMSFRNDDGTPATKSLAPPKPKPLDDDIPF